MLCIFNHTEKTEQKAIAQLAESKETAGVFSPLLIYSYMFFFISNSRNDGMELSENNQRSNLNNGCKIISFLHTDFNSFRFISCVTVFLSSLMCSSIQIGTVNNFLIFIIHTK